MPNIQNKLPSSLRTVPLEKLEPFQGNIKHIEPENLNRLIESIKKLGFIMPVFLWEGRILDGHQRKLALEALEAPVPQEEGRVVRVERPREVLGQQAGERRQVGGFQDPLGDLPERGAAARGGEGEDPHGLSIDTPKNPSL